MNILIIILGLLPGFAWLLFYLQEETHPEPKRMIALAFFVGAIAAIVSLFLEFFVNCFQSQPVSICIKNPAAEVELTFFSIVAFSLIEEVTKFLAVYFAVSKTKYFSEPVDAMFYMAVAALGFATLENLGALSGSGKPVLLNGLFEIAIFRMVGTTLLHTLTASITGYFWALGIREFKRTRLIIYGLLVATVLHAIFNYLIIAGENLVYPIIFVTLVGFFVLNDFEKLKGRKV